MVDLMCVISGGSVEHNHFTGESSGVVFYAMLDVASGRYVKGCPCGRGSTTADAMADLWTRIARENAGLAFELTCVTLAQ